MAKNKKKNIAPITLSNQELIPSVIGVIDEKEKSNWPLIFLFILLIAFIVGLPRISNFIHGEDNIINNPPSENNQEEKDPNTPHEEIDFNHYSEDLIVKIEGISFQNFLIQEKELSLSITNNSEAKDYLVSHKLYLELYDSNRTFLQRIKLPSENLSKNTTQTYKFELTTSNQDIKELVISEKTAIDMPSVNLTKEDNDTYSLICTKNSERVNYEFDNAQKLKSLTQTINYLSSETTYQQLVTEYRQISSIYNAIEGVNSSIVETQSGFTVTTIIDVEKVDYKNRNVQNTLKNNVFYQKDTEGKVIVFELQAMNYQCNS